MIDCPFLCGTELGCRGPENGIQRFLLDRRGQAVLHVNAHLDNSIDLFIDLVSDRLGEVVAAVYSSIHDREDCFIELLKIYLAWVLGLDGSELLAKPDVLPFEQVVVEDIPR